ncbi:MAG: glycosyltransferase family 39 protein [Actinobacteria bacterium]|nr:glycosyltransferase family 39 protein [Actinomycetota bacterium]
MPLQDFLAGAALFSVMLAAVVAAAALVVRRRLRHLDALETSLASIVVGTAVLIGVHLLPLMLGVLARGTVIAAAALAVGLAALVRPAGEAPAHADGGPRAAAPASSRASWAMAALAGGFTAAAALANLARWGGDEVIGDDPTSFHLPGIGRWIQDGTLWQIDQFVPLLAQGYYPNNGDVVLLSTILPWHNDFLVRLPAVFFLATTAVATFAVARELRASHAASLLAAAAVVSLPVVGYVTIPRALPDAIMWTTFACGALFLLRHARTGGRSDLVLAGVALGIAAGTKWYGVSSVPVALAVWVAARALAARRAGAPGRGATAGVLRDGVLVGTLAFLGMLVWLVRNLALSGNPVFPLNVELLGVSIFDAPRDVIRDEVGFSIADYAGRPDVLAKVAIKVLEGLGGAPVLGAIGIVAAVALARRGGRAREPRVLVLAVAAVALALLYTLTPATALGLRDTPSLAHANTRYAIPALLLALPVLAWVTGRVRPIAGRSLEAMLALAVLSGAYDGYQVLGASDIVAAALALAALAGAAWLLWRLRERRTLLAGAAIAAALVALAAGDRMQSRINDDRYGHFDPGLDALLRAAPGGRRVALAFSTYWSLGDLSPVWPAFGTRIDNDVEFVGEFVDGFLTPYSDEARFRAALERGRYDVLAVGRSPIPRQNTPAERWAIDAGWRTIALSERLRVLVAPQRAQDGPAYGSRRPSALRSPGTLSSAPSARSRAPSGRSSAARRSSSRADL